MPGEDGELSEPEEGTHICHLAAETKSLIRVSSNPLSPSHTPENPQFRGGNHPLIFTPNDNYSVIIIIILQ